MDEIIRVFGIDWRLLIIQAVNFGIVLIILQRFLYKPVLKMLDERKAKIAAGVKSAEEAGAKLQNAEAEARSLMNDAEGQARETMLMSKKAAEEKAEAIKKVAEEAQARMRADAEKEVEDMKLRAIKESQEEIAKLGILAAERVLRTKSS